VRDGQPVRFARKSPAKPLLLLKGLIATGGRQVGTSRLASIIWPDKEGDLAQRTFETTLHRLRKYLGDDRYLIMEDGRLTLNSERVWVDVWECERQFTKMRGLLAHYMDADKVNEVSVCADHIMRIYQGHFLSREQTTCWSVSLEERLRSRFVHSMLAMGRFWEQQGLPAKAVVCYQRGIDVDDLIETFYQRLMLCLHRTGRQPEAMACYRKCEHVLDVVLGLQPTEETQKIYHSVLSQHEQQAC
jgi:two-component SAPR family response regulator